MSFFGSELKTNEKNCSFIAANLTHFRFQFDTDDQRTHTINIKSKHLSQSSTGMSNLASKLGQIGPKWDKSGTF